MATIARGRPVPGPRGHPVLGSLPDFQRDMLRTFMEARREFGDVVRFRGPLSVYLLAHPDYVDHILHQEHQNYRHPDFELNKLRPTFRNGLVTSQGDFWRRQRRLAQPAFHRQRIAKFGTIMTDMTAEMLQRWRGFAERGRAIDVRVAMQRLTLTVLAKAMFGVDWSHDAEAVMEAVTVANEYTNQRLLAPLDLPDWLPLPSTRRFMQTRQAVDDIVYRLIRERRQSGEDTGDLLSMLMEARDEETGEGMSDLQLHDELISMIFAGHETVSTCLTWTWYLLSKHAGIEQRLQAELAEVLGGRTPTLEDIPRLTYTTMLLQESLRLYPPIWLIPRTPINDDEIGGYHIPAGTMIFLVPYVTHRHPEFWENPEGVDPERFTPERSAGRPRYAWFPFGGGPRQCIGNSFAMLEMQLIVALIAQRYRLNLVPGHQVILQPMVTLRPRYGMAMTLEPRS
jgi:enediyne biosynthesis protein E7